MRTSDLVWLLLLQRPVRCHVCLHRRYVNILWALTLRDKSPGTPGFPS
jgi:hypothetical protein